MAIQHEPYFRSVAVHYDGHLELAEKRFRRWHFAGNVGEFSYLWVASPDSVKWSRHACEKVTQRLHQGESIGWCRHQEHHIQTAAQTNCGQWCCTVTQNNAECLILKPDFVRFLCCCCFFIALSWAVDHLVSKTMQVSRIYRAASLFMASFKKRCDLASCSCFTAPSTHLKGDKNDRAD